VGGELAHLARTLERGLQQFETGQIEPAKFAQMLRQAADTLEAQAGANTPQRESLIAMLSRPYRAGTTS
jgi:hypothetical protein